MLAAHIIERMFHFVLDLSWAANGINPHYKGLLLELPYHGKRTKNLAICIYCPGLKPALLVSWRDYTAPDLQHHRDWKLISYHDAAFRPMLEHLFQAVAELGMTDLYALRSEVLDESFRQHIHTLLCGDQCSFDEARTYLMSVKEAK